MAHRAWLAASLLLLAACKEEAPPAREGAAAPAAGREAAALRAAEERLRARLRAEGPMTLRARQVHRQALADTLAVCGQINPTGRGEDPFIPYVAVVAFEGDRPARTDLHLAASTTEATRVYVEMVDRCFDGGGPPNARATQRPLPPVPTGLPLAGEEPSAPRPGPAAAASGAAPLPAGSAPPMAAAGPAQGSATTSQRTPVNIRSSPSGGGEVLRVVPRGSSLTVFGQAPGGWYQVGEGEPWGWVHGSMLDQAPR
ncbi:SH3 domain-containing protein [Falsiroseomonas sp. CW058]|uniref:SH3 domain-containing protein n=1 Tax=Falsiroseomonas sp. CW058 TaxID=3388664 RepID=UPI003D312227